VYVGVDADCAGNGVQAKAGYADGDSDQRSETEIELWPP
jgi:hypothetical protein